MSNLEVAPLPVIGRVLVDIAFANSCQNGDSGRIAVAPGADVLVLAGDVHEGFRAIELYGECVVPVVYVTGNHDPLGFVYEDFVSELREHAKGTFFPPGG
jgi:predicted phosphodiesterase